jgi:hypothetical protein
MLGDPVDRDFSLTSCQLVLLILALVAVALAADVDPTVAAIFRKLTD